MLYEEQHRLSARERTYADLMLALNRSLLADDVLVHVVETAGRLLDQETRVDESAHVVQRRGRVLAQGGGELLVGHRPALGEPDDAQARVRGQGGGLGPGRGALLRGERHASRITD